MKIQEQAYTRSSFPGPTLFFFSLLFHLQPTHSYLPWKEGVKKQTRKHLWRSKSKNRLEVNFSFFQFTSRTPTSTFIPPLEGRCSQNRLGSTCEDWKARIHLKFVSGSNIVLSSLILHLPPVHSYFLWKEGAVKKDSATPPTAWDTAIVRYPQTQTGRWDSPTGWAFMQVHYSYRPWDQGVSTRVPDCFVAWNCHIGHWQCCVSPMGLSHSWRK